MRNFSLRRNGIRQSLVHHDKCGDGQEMMHTALGSFKDIRTDPKRGEEGGEHAMPMLMEGLVDGWMDRGRERVAIEHRCILRIHTGWPIT
jgi:hypothetical protein